uniref:Pentacotripeptide-repeat region of PRORP domain-containing protein n=1 Tax=Daucus carota subsp. sativus TaxID=79200 RepID=A0A161ZRF9_DAUCS
MNARNTLREAIDSLYKHGRATTETYTRLVLDCVRQNDIQQAKRLQSHMDIHLEQPTTTFVHNRLLQFYAKSGYLSDARNLFDRMSHRDIFTYNAMLSGYCKLGSVDELKAFFDGMPCRDSVSYNTVISGLASSGCCNEALKVFVRMQKEGFEFTDYTLVSVLNVCSMVMDLRRGKEIHGRILVDGFGGNVFVWNTLVDMYAKCGHIDQARWLFNRMVNKNVVSWNLMISGYMKHGKPDECIGLFRDMKVSGLRPDQVTISNILGAFLRIGNMDEAEKLFAEIKEKDKVSWTTMIAGYVQNNMEEDALILFGQMLSENIKADKFTISIITGLFVSWSGSSWKSCSYGG